jgi:glycosyltransferase involved in cell wall biosynthesis
MMVSIVTPSYNQGCYLADTIESILRQEGDFQIDYIIVDGASTDGSVEIITHYEKLLETGNWPVKCRGITFRWISEKDRGQTEALMKGLRMATGEVLAWLNSDDLYLPGTLQAVAAFFRTNPGTALLYGDADYCDTVGNFMGRYPTEKFEFAKLAYFNFICQPSTFFRKRAFEAVGGLDETLHYVMDYDLFVRIGKQFACRYVPQVFSKYRLHETSKTMLDEALFDNHEEALRSALKHFGWAPLNRVYGACNYFCLSRLPAPLAKLRFLVIGATIFCTLPRSLLLNRGLRRADLKLLRLNNFRKLTKDRIEILQG